MEDKIREAVEVIDAWLTGLRYITAEQINNAKETLKSGIEQRDERIRGLEKKDKDKLKVGDKVKYHKEHGYEILEEIIKRTCVYTDKDSTHIIYYMESGYDCHEKDIIS